MAAGPVLGADAGSVTMGVAFFAPLSFYAEEAAVLLK